MRRILCGDKGLVIIKVEDLILVIKCIMFLKSISMLFAPMFKYEILLSSLEFYCEKHPQNESLTSTYLCFYCFQLKITHCTNSLHIPVERISCSFMA